MFKKYFLLQIFLLFILTLTPEILRGSHIVGGEITYKFLSRNGRNITYRISMKVYRDIYTQNQGAVLDNPARVAIYIKKPTGTGYNPYNTLSVSITNRIPEIPLPSSPCLSPPINAVGLESGEYQWETTLLDTNVSYVLAYQRCCRNNTILNIENARVSGATYFVEITPEAQKSNNSSPTFNALPPILICGGEPLKFDHAASDIDGDQLVYKLCSPILGGSDRAPAPNPPTAPPYTDVTFKRPDFTPERPLGGSPAVIIDPNTGLIFGTPNSLGQYVVSVCVEEYRNGKLLSKIFRDFQFNVVSCTRDILVKVQADTSKIIGVKTGANLVDVKSFIVLGCENNPYTFQNLSNRSKVSSFYWEFDIKGETIRFTDINDWNPTITFRDTGTYLGKLFLNPNTPCSDSAYVKAIIGGRLDSQIGIVYDTCKAGPIAFTGSVKSAFPLKDIVWEYGDGASDTGKVSTLHNYEKPGLKTIKLKLKDVAGCKRDTTTSFTWQPAPPILIVEPDNFLGCAPATVFFNNKSKPIDTTYKITWDFGDNTFGKDISPRHLYARADTYSVKLLIVSPLGCKKEATFKSWIKIKNSPKADFDFVPKFITNLNPNMLFEDKSSPDVNSWRWYIGTRGYSTRRNPAYTFRDTGIQSIKLFVRNTEGCSDSVVKDVNIEPRIKFFFPNAFSPNDDTVNDEFKGTGFLFGLKSYNMTIWNRWGEMIFRATNPDDGWNGLKNNTGQQVPAGIYTYEVQYVTPQNEIVTKRDFVTVIR